MGLVQDASSQVQVPHGLTVTIDGEAEAFWIRVDGTLDVVIYCSTTLRVDTLVVTPEGLYRNLSQSSSKTIFTGGEIDTIWDPYAFCGFYHTERSESLVVKLLRM